jgi:hypothetical protein
MVVTDAFRLKHAINVLDFSLLEDAYDRNPLSHFQPDHDERARRREFVRNLHSKIQQPVLPGKEQDYLITQAFAEYLALIHEPRFDGIMFESAQCRGGRNIVLFPHVIATAKPQTASRSGEMVLDYCPDETRIHKVRSVHYKTDPIKAENGAVFSVFLLVLLCALNK